MQRIIRQRIETGQAGDAVVKFGWNADAIAQTYLDTLSESVPRERDHFLLLGTPLNRSERTLLLHVRKLNEALCQLARADRWHACAELWDQALKLTNTFCELALKNSEPFKTKARLSLVMPALRVPPTLRKAGKGRTRWVDPFLGDSPEIAKAIELSAATVGAKISDNRVRLGGLCARLVGECVHEIKRSRELWSLFFTPYSEPVVWPTRRQIQPFVGRTTDELIAGIKARLRGKTTTTADHLRSFCLLADCGWERLHFLVLPELTRETAKIWWKNAIETMVERRFPALLHDLVWLKQLKTVSSGTQADMRKELKDYCRDKVKQFV